MIGNTHSIIAELVKYTGSVILFHSICGKDSIVLLDLLVKNNIKVKPIFMYMIKDLEQTNIYLQHTEIKYNVKFELVPHPVLMNYIRQGYMGIKKDKKQRRYTVAQLTKLVCEKHNIEWSVFGFKKMDSLNRRIMLNELPQSIYYNTKKCYPLADWTNKEVMAYINRNKLLKPVKIDNRPSYDIVMDDPIYLSWCKKNYPNDFKKIITVFPESEALLLAYENKTV
jgi:sulfate adenylyltransferase subunit 2